MTALTIIVRPDGSTYACPPFAERIEVDDEAWADLFDCADTLHLVAQNGEPVVYELEDDEEQGYLVFRRAVTV